MNKKRYSLGSKVGFGSLEEQEPFIEGKVFQNQRSTETV